MTETHEICDICGLKLAYTRIYLEITRRYLYICRDCDAR